MMIFHRKKTSAKYQIYMAAALIVLLSATIASGQELQRTTIQVENLACGSCLSVIEKQLQRVPGMVGITAYPENRLVAIDHNLKITGPQIASIISHLGYPARVVRQEKVDRSEAQHFTNSPLFQGGTGGCSSTGCSATAASWKELYRRFIARLK